MLIARDRRRNNSKLVKLEETASHDGLSGIARCITKAAGLISEDSQSI